MNEEGADSIGVADLKQWLARFAEVIAENRAELSRLDAAIGDGDHGTNMDRGMRKAVEKLDGLEAADPSFSR